MNAHRGRAFAALTAAGLLWGTTVPLSKVALEWLPPGWLTVARFGVAAAMLAPAARSGLRAASRPAVLISGAIGYGGFAIVQNAGITLTSVSHAALLIAAAPVLVAVISALWHRRLAPAMAWAGFAVSLAGVGLITGSRGGGATAAGDGLVLASLVLSSAFTVAQERLLAGRDMAAVTAIQFLAAAVAALPAAIVEGIPAAPGSPGHVAAVAGLALGGTLVPYTLFAYGQTRVPAELAGAFVNLEPLVGAFAGVVIFGNPAGRPQLAGGAAILAGLTLSTLRTRRKPSPPEVIATRSRQAAAFYAALGFADACDRSARLFQGSAAWAMTRNRHVIRWADLDGCRGAAVAVACAGRSCGRGHADADRSGRCGRPDPA